MGTFTKAAQGFVRGKGLTVEDMNSVKSRVKQYVYVTKEEIGQAVEDIVPGVVDVLKSI